MRLLSGQVLLARAARINVVVGIMVFVISIVIVLLAQRQMTASLKADAVEITQRWFEAGLVNNDKIDRLLRGEVLSIQERQRLDVADAAGKIDTYSVYSSEGYLVRSLAGSLRLSDGDEFTARQAAIRAAKTLQPTTISLSVGEDRRFVTKVFLPVLLADGAVGIVSPTIDQTLAYRSALDSLFLTIAAIVVLATSALVGTLVMAFVLNQQKASDAQARHLARHDILTGVANRAEFVAVLDAAVAGKADRPNGFALLMIDLDRFKSINDTLGHQVGDGVLTEVARRLAQCTREYDLIARLGGDEFAIIQQSLSSPADAANLAHRISLAVREIETVGGTPIAVTTSIGVAISEPDFDATELQRLADAALYCAKEAGRDQYVVFEPGMDEAMRRRGALRNLIREAMRAKSFELHFQPLHDARTSELTGFEALLRLEDHDGEQIAPAEFVPIAEDMGATPEIGAWVLEEATRIAVTWPSPISVSVNLSPQQFQSDVASDVRRALELSGLEANRLEVEITENLFIEDPDRVQEQLHQMKDLGVRVVMDDFGTGYSSLQHLWKFPFDKLKVDRSCFTSLEESDSVKEVLRTISAMSGAMNLRVTAEGVETAAQRAFARASGYHEVQGFLFARPMPVHEIEAYLEATMLARPESGGPDASEEHLPDNTVPFPSHRAKAGGLPGGEPTQDGSGDAPPLSDKVQSNDRSQQR